MMVDQIKFEQHDQIKLECAAKRKKAEWKSFTLTIHPNDFVLNAIQHMARNEGGWYRKNGMLSRW